MAGTRRPLRLRMFITMVEESPASGRAGVIEMSVFFFALYSAYNRAAVKASSAGCFTAPVLVWYRITDASGNTLHRSSPVMLAPAEEYRPPRAVIKLSSGDGGYTHVLAGQVSVRAFSIAMRIAAVPDSSWARKAAAVEVYVSPALAVVDAGADASFDFGDADGSYGTVTATLPLKLLSRMSMPWLVCFLRP